MNEVARGLSAVTKIDSRYLRAGLGYGGSCLPKDLRALTAQYEALGIDPELLQTVAHVNEKRVSKVVNIVKQHLGDLKNKKVAVLGLAFKPRTNDVRESAALKLSKLLAGEGAIVKVYDPKALTTAKTVLGNTVQYAGSAEECIRGASACIVATPWEEFKKIEGRTFRELMQTPFLVDCWGIYDSLKMAKTLAYTTLGKSGNVIQLRLTVKGLGEEEISTISRPPK